MPWYSILPPHLSGIETWIIRICLILALVNLSPWLIAIAFDIIVYLFRFTWHYIPVYGGRAQGETRPRAPSLADSRRRRTLSLTAMMSGASRDQVRDEHRGMRQRHARTLSNESVAEEEDEDKDSG